MAMAHSTKQVRWLCYLLINIGRLKKHAPPTSILVDNTGVITLAKEARFHPRTRHIGVQYHFSRQQVEKGRITFMHVPTAEMLADGFTKPLACDGIMKLTNGCTLCPV